MPDPENFDVWIWNSAHPEQPSRSRRNTRAPSTFPRAKRRKEEAGSIRFIPNSPTPSLPYPPLHNSPKYGSAISRSQRLDSCTLTSSPPIPPRLPLLRRLESFSTGEILYALVTLGLARDVQDSLIQHGGLLPDIYMLSPLSINPLKQAHRICGYAYTIEMTHSAECDTRTTQAQHLLEAASSDSIIVASLPPGAGCSAWDKTLTSKARRQGVRGAIVSGLATDLVAHRETGFSVFAQGCSPPSQVALATPTLSRANVPITFLPRSHFGTHFKDSLPAVKVRPGDIIVADVGGAVCIPLELAEQVFHLCNSSTTST